MSQEEQKKCKHSDKCMYLGCPHNKHYKQSKSNYIGIDEDMDNCTVWCDFMKTGGLFL